MRKILIFFMFMAVIFAGITSCKNETKALLPNVSGKAGEVIIAMDKDNWEGDLGADVRDALGGDTPYLAQKEPLFTLVNVSPTNFADLFRVHRNIVIFTIDSNISESGVKYRNNIWANPQCVIEINAKDSKDMLNVFRENSVNVINALEMAERDRIIANCKLYEEASVAKELRATFGGSPHFPSGYKLKKKTENFAWIADEKQYSIQGVFIYRYPAAKNENFTMENIISHRNEILKENVPGMFENTWMTTSTFITPTVDFVRFRGRQFAQTRGFWEVQNDFMGGPFVSHAFYGPNAKEIIVVEAWVYAPKYDKRQYLRQVESIIYSFEWDENKVEAK